MDRPSRLDVTRPAWLSCDRWNESVVAGTPTFSPISPAGMPPGPCRTSSRNTARRESWASAPSASTTSTDSIFPRYWKYRIMSRGPAETEDDGVAHLRALGVDDHRHPRREAD